MGSESELAARPSTADGEPFIAHLHALGELALQRHHTLRERHPKRSTAPYLRTALTCARELLKHVAFHPEVRQQAQTLIDQVITAAQEAEAACFAADGNSAPYIAVLVAAEGLRLSMADAPLAERKRNLGTIFHLEHYQPGYTPPPLSLLSRMLRDPQPDASSP
jgi:hypothetical protein